MGSKVYAGVLNDHSAPLVQPSSMSFSGGMSLARRASMMRASDGVVALDSGVSMTSDGPQRGAISTTGSRRLGGAGSRRVTQEGETDDDDDHLPVGRTPASFTTVGYARRASVMRASEGASLMDNKPSTAFFSSAMAARRSSVMRASEGCALVPEVSAEVL